jgi:hypothetical protein
MWSCAENAYLEVLSAHHLHLHRTSARQILQSGFLSRGFGTLLCLLT